jgi:hypothetical protein
VCVRVSESVCVFLRERERESLWNRAKKKGEIFFVYTFAHVLMVSVLKVYSGDSEGVRTKKEFFFCFGKKDFCCSNIVEDLPNSMLDFLIYSFSCAHRNRNIGQNKQN